MHLKVKLLFLFVEKVVREKRLWQMMFNSCAEEKRNHYYEHRFSRAIGSIQIVQGSFAREFGYCPDYKKHQTPTDSPFENYNSVSDRNFRRECRRNGKHPDFQQPIQLPNVFRLSHPNRKLSPEKAKRKYGWYLDQGQDS